MSAERSGIKHLSVNDFIKIQSVIAGIQLDRGFDSRSISEKSATALVSEHASRYGFVCDIDTSDNHFAMYLRVPNYIGYNRDHLKVWSTRREK